MGRGEMICLLGPNGCGKSTLLRTVAGLQPALSGSVQLVGEELASISISERSRILSLVLTDPIETLGMRVSELVSLGRNPFTGFLGRLSASDELRVNEALEQVNLSSKREQSLFELSDGERQRALIAKALAQDTPIIFLDEPTAHLDLPNRVEIMLLLHHLAQDMGKTILISTHELELALQVADRILLMKPNGGVVDDIPESLVVSGALQQVFRNPAVRFDPFSGTFLLNHPLRGTLSVVTHGEGYLSFWTERALSRIGFRIAADSLLVVQVDEQKKSWRVEIGDASQSTGSLANLLEIVRNLSESVIKS